MLRKFQDGSLTLAAYSLAGLSVLVCGYFGTILATGLEGLIYATILACLDILKFNLPDIAETMLRKRRFGWLVVAIVLILPLSIMSITCELGVYAATVRHATGPQLAAQHVYNQGVKDQADLEKRIHTLSAMAVEDARAELDRLRFDKLYTQTKSCTDATLPESRMFCADVAKADAELEKAKTANNLRFQLAAVKARNNAVDPQAIVTSATPQADTIVAVAAILGFTMDKASVPNIIALIIAALMELVVVVFWLMRNMREEPRQETAVTVYRPKPEAPAPVRAREPEPLLITSCRDPRVSEWVETELERRSRGAVAFSLLLHRYNEWAERRGHPAISDVMLGRRLGELGFKKEKVGGRMQYTGLAFRERRPKLIAK